MQYKNSEILPIIEIYCAKVLHTLGITTKYRTCLLL